MGRVVIFLEAEIFDVSFGISVPKYIKMGVVAIALPKNDDHTRPFKILCARLSESPFCVICYVEKYRVSQKLGHHLFFVYL